tara:strand:+ start:349 stop:936 length:588 start_codon:yes stop_codon:yes gene_type:complete
MEYVKPLNEADANAPYIDGDASQDIEGSEVPAAAIEQPMREVVNVIKHFLGDEAPNGEDLTQLVQAISKASSTGPYDIAFAAGRGAGGAGEDVSVQTYASAQLARNTNLTGSVGKAGVVPTGSDVEFDIEVNGVSIYATKPKIVAGATDLTDGVLTTSPDPFEANAGDVINFKVLAVGSLVAGQLVTFTVKGAGR